MALPTDAITVIYYSGSVNIASTNSQSLVNTPPLLPPPTQPAQQTIAARISRHIDNVIQVASSLSEVISIFESLIAHRLKSSVFLTGSATLSDSLKRIPKLFLAESISIKALVFNGQDRVGTGNYVQLNSIASFTNQVTVVAWVKFINADNRGYGGVISFINGYFGTRLLLNEDAQTILFETGTTLNAIVDLSYTLPGTVFSNAWHHFAAVYDGSQSQVQLYLDGALVATGSQAGNLLSGAGKPLIGLGSSNAYYLHGNVAELALYNIALSAGQISNVYNNGANTVATGQVSYYKFNEGSGSTIHDSTGTINGQIINDQLWSTDVHSPLPNPSIYQGYFAPESIVRRIARPLVQVAQTIVESFKRLPVPFIRENIFLSDLVYTGPQILLSEIIHITEGYGFTSGFTSGFTTPIVGLLRKVIPKITTETISSAESKVRKVIPKLTSQTISISDLVKYSRARVLLETITIVESRLRKAIPRIATQTTSISESQLRKPIPRIATQVISILDQLLRKPGARVTGTVSITDASLRTAKPRIVTQTITISEQIKRLIARTISQAIAIVDAKVSKVIPKLVAQTISIAESQLRKPKPSLTTQTITISELLKGVKGRFLTGTVSVATATVSKIAKHFRTETDSATISETQARKPIPKITTQVITIVEASIKRGITRKLNQTISIVEALLRRMKITLVGTSTISDAVAKIAIHLRPISDAITILDSKIRKAIPKITTAAITISDSKIRKVIPKVVAQVITTTGVLGNGAQQTIAQTVTITEKLVRKAIPKITVQTVTISESIKKKIGRTIAQSISILELLVRKYIRRVASTDTVTISDSIGKTSQVASIKTVIYNIQSGAVPSTFPGGQGFAGEGETKNRPIPVRDYIRDYTMRYRKRWKGNW